MEVPITDLPVHGGAEEAWAFGALVGKSQEMRRVVDISVKLADSSATVLISGESGTGKELIARSIHRLSPRSDRPFVPVNCAAIPEELLESELFGHVRGAFTGAISARQGRFQLANGGTLFLDEVGEMSVKLQVKLLRVLQEREFEPVGSDRVTQVDVRVVAATNRDLRAAVKEGTFREDLFYRLNVLPLCLPPLRERPTDIPNLVAHFLELYNGKKKRGVGSIEVEALARLTRYNWPGNVRELENLMERLVVLNDDGVIRDRDLPDYVVNVPSQQEERPLNSVLSLPNEGVDLDGLLKEMENRLILQALKRTQGNKTLAAELLRLNRTTLIERMRRRGLDGASRSLPLSPVRKTTANEFSLTA